MNRDDVIRMAIKAGDDWTGTHPKDQEFLIRFAGLIATAEREACKDLWEAQKLTDRQISDHIVAAVEAEREACAAIANEHKEHCYDGDQDWYKCRSIEEAIRERGNT